MEEGKHGFVDDGYVGEVLKQAEAEGEGAGWGNADVDVETAVLVCESAVHSSVLEDSEESFGLGKAGFVVEV